MNYNFELSRFLDKLREKHKISYEDYLKYRSMADTLAMENDRLEKECKEYEQRVEITNRILHDFAAGISCDECPYLYLCEKEILQSKDAFEYCFQKLLEIGEKRLQEVTDANKNNDTTTSP